MTFLTETQVYNVVYEWLKNHSLKMENDLFIVHSDLYTVDAFTLSRLLRVRVSYGTHLYIS